VHDEYGKRLFASILLRRWDDWSHERWVEMAGVRAVLDGVVRSEDLTRVECAVEIEAKIYKQIRGALLDLAWHPAPRKMLVVILAQSQLGNASKARNHLEFCWQKLTQGSDAPFVLVILEGTGLMPADETDRLLLTRALRSLGLI
jgi:hypothetical protein